jgi:hypothetical protein
LIRRRFADQQPLGTIGLQGLLIHDPVQQTPLGMITLNDMTGVDALSALGAGEHQPLDMWLWAAVICVP